MENRIFQPHSVFVRQFFSFHHSNPPSPATSSPRYFFAVIEIGIGCYGVGHTHADAIDRARIWLACEPGLHDVPNYSPDFTRGILCVAKCTERYAVEVERRGGCAWIQEKISTDQVLDINVDAMIYDRGNA